MDQNAPNHKVEGDAVEVVVVVGGEEGDAVVVVAVVDVNNMGTV